MVRDEATGIAIVVRQDVDAIRDHEEIRVPLRSARVGNLPALLVEIVRRTGTAIAGRRATIVVNDRNAQASRA